MVEEKIIIQTENLSVTDAHAQAALMFETLTKHNVIFSVHTHYFNGYFDESCSYDFDVIGVVGIDDAHRLFANADSLNSSSLAGMVTICFSGITKHSINTTALNYTQAEIDNSFCEI